MSRQREDRVRSAGRERESDTERGRARQLVVRLRDRLDLDERRQKQLVWAMEVGLVGMFFIGIAGTDVGIIVNTAVALGVTQLVPVLERDYGVPMDPTLTLWITSAVFLHALGTVVVPGSEVNLYQTVWWWDHLTHALSASVVAATGYATARAFDIHSEETRLPPQFMFVFILVVTLAFGVFWEVVEFALGELAAVLGAEPVVTQYGLDDTMLDLLFDTAGAVVVAVWGTAHLGDVVGALVDRFGARSG